ncbi:Aldo/keto reductase [Testicularia cyperi]|uniref:Aldo/keto reductase n=1 Tax=Testicularia cyperi TaxID=1882483 RepID=A0A317XG24_9BASI|nr:Aldo/keto reductase [Testicularia cyperi]
MASKLSLQTAYTLKGTGAQMPVLGFGVYQSPTDVAIASVTTALKTGYRHIDGAQYYGNEKEAKSRPLVSATCKVGEAVRKWCQETGSKRSDVFVTTKIIAPEDTLEKTLASVRNSVEVANLDGYVDCFLVHTPTSGPEGRKHLWQALKQLQAEGKVKTPGVSNFGVKHLEEIQKTGELPAVNQIEIHPWCQQRPIVEYCKQNNIVLQAYCPIVRGKYADDAELNEIAKKHGVSWAQVLIRWSLQKGYVPLPKSDTPSRIASNADVFDFELDEDDMAKLDAKDLGKEGAVAPNPVDCP